MLARETSAWHASVRQALSSSSEMKRGQSEKAPPHIIAQAITYGEIGVRLPIIVVGLVRLDIVPRRRLPHLQQRTVGVYTITICAQTASFTFLGP